MRNPSTRNPTPLSRSRALIALVGGLLAISASGCMGGAHLREPNSGLTLEKSRWVFPLFHYEERDGQKTFTPFFLVPIPVGKTEAALALETDSELVDPGATVADGRPLRSINTLDTNGADAPAWGGDERGAPPPVVSLRTPDTVSPGVWDSSLPPAPPVAALDLADPLTRSHQVRPGDTLFALATRYYGSGKQWRRIADANRDRMPSPEKLPVGVRLRIP